MDIARWSEERWLFWCGCMPVTGGAAASGGAGCVTRGGCLGRRPRVRDPAREQPGADRREAAHHHEAAPGAPCRWLHVPLQACSLQCRENMLFAAPQPASLNAGVAAPDAVLPVRNSDC